MSSRLDPPHGRFRDKRPFDPKASDRSPLGIAAHKRARCSQCRSYFDRDEAYRIARSGRWCSAECFIDGEKAKYEKAKAKAAEKRAAAKPRSARRRPFADPEWVKARAETRERDGMCCRWCGSSRDIHVHHVSYRSEGGADHVSNLITLCARHHELAHSNKRYWKPILLATLWLHHFEGIETSVPEVESMLLETQEIEPLRESA